MRWDIVFVFALLFNDCDISSTLSSGSLFWLMRFFLQTTSYLHCTVCLMFRICGFRIIEKWSAHLPLTMVAIQIILLLILFMFQYKYLKWSVQQPEKFNHNIFFQYFSPPFCCTMAVKPQWFKIFSLTLIHPNSSCFNVSFKVYLLKRYLVPSYKIKLSTPYLL